MLFLGFSFQEPIKAKNPTLNLLEYLMKRHFWKMPIRSLQGDASSPLGGIFIWAVCTVLYRLFNPNTDFHQ